MYHLGFRCKVVGQTSDRAVAAGQPPVWCEGDPESCVQGPKQMLYWHQFEGNNVEVEGYDLAGDPKSPAYNEKCGFKNGGGLASKVTCDDDQLTGLEICAYSPT